MIMESLLADFFISRERLLNIKLKIEDAFNKGLSKNKDDEFYYRPLKMVPTHFSNKITGDEVGRFLAIDLGGTNLRFIEIFIENGNLNQSPIIAKNVPKEYMTGTGEELFNFIAQHIEECLIIKELADKEITWFGFTFSFPCHQLALNSATLIRWTKGYCASGVEGKDVVILLKEAVQRRNLKIKNFVLINDTTGTLLCGANEERDTRIGLINGTGTNACYVEKTSKITKWKCSLEENSVIVNTEWGAFGENNELSNILTFADMELDKYSINPKSQIFEKLISGMYLGEIVRLILKKAYELNLLLPNGIPSLLQEKYSFQTDMISESYNKKKFLKEFYDRYKTCLENSEYIKIAQICDIISQRSAGLCAAGLSALLQRFEEPKIVIAVDGSMFTKHPYYKDYVKAKLKYLNNGNNFKLKKVNDGSGKGAALAACVATYHYSQKETPQINKDKNFSKKIF